MNFGAISLLKICMLGTVIFHPFVVTSADFFQNHFFFQKILSGTLSECKLVRIQIRTDILWVLILIQTDWNGKQQTTKVAPSRMQGKN